MSRLIPKKLGGGYMPLWYNELSDEDKLRFQELTKDFPQPYQYQEYPLKGTRGSGYGKGIWDALQKRNAKKRQKDIESEIKWINQLFGRGYMNDRPLQNVYPEMWIAPLVSLDYQMLPKVINQTAKLIKKSPINRTVQPNGKIRLSLPSSTEAQPRQIVLEPLGNNRYGIHIRTWDGDHIPANLSVESKNALYKAMVDELPQGAEIALPQSGPNYYATRGTIAGLLRLARDPRFTLGTKGIVEYVDKDGNIKQFEGSSFIKTPRITEENASSMTPEQWTAAQDAAIAKGDMVEAQRLRDLHFKVSAPNSVTYDVFHHGNTKPMDWYIFDPERIGTTDEGYSGAGYYFAPTRPADQYSREHFAHSLGPHGEENAGLSGGRHHRYVYLNGETKYKPIREYDWTTHTDFPFVDNRPIEVVVGNNRQIKLADAVTYDAGKRIPLGERDNFDVNDVRYSLRSDLSGKPAGISVPKAMRKADSDIALMNQYHADNVAAYNEATGSNVISIPFREDFTRRRTVILPNDEFNTKILEFKSNSPTEDIRNIGGFYNSKNDEVYLRLKGNPNGAYHEFLHSGYYGVTNPEVTKWRISQLIDENKIEHLPSKLKRYYLSEIEAPVYLRQQGERMNINVGDPYPGDESFDKLIEDYGIGGSSYYMKRTTPEEKTLLWRAFNGTLFGLGAYGVSKKKQGGRLIPKAQTGLKEQRIAENQHHSTLAKHYVLHPTLPNLAKAAYHWYKGTPGLGGQPENDYIYKTGIVPLPDTPISVVKRAETVATGTKYVGPSAKVTSMFNNAQAMEKGTVQATTKKLTRNNLKHNQEILSLRLLNPDYERQYNKIARKLFMTDDPKKIREGLKLILDLTTLFKKGL